MPPLSRHIPGAPLTVNSQKVINKIDLPTADVERVAAEMVDCFDVELDDIIYVSAKSGIGEWN